MSFRSSRFPSLSGGQTKANFGGGEKKPRFNIMCILIEEDITVHKNLPFANYNMMLLVKRDEAARVMKEIQNKIPPDDYKLVRNLWRNVKLEELLSPEFFSKESGNNPEDYFTVFIQGPLDKFFDSKELGDPDRTDPSAFDIPEMLNQTLNVVFYISIKEANNQYPARAYMRGDSLSVITQGVVAPKKDDVKVHSSEQSVADQLPF